MNIVDGSLEYSGGSQYATGGTHRRWGACPRGAQRRCQEIFFFFFFLERKRVAVQIMEKAEIHWISIFRQDVPRNAKE